MLVFFSRQPVGYAFTFLKDTTSNLAATSGGGRQFAVLLRPLRGLRAQQMPNKGKDAWNGLQSQNSLNVVKTTGNILALSPINMHSDF